MCFFDGMQEHFDSEFMSGRLISSIRWVQRNTQIHFQVAEQIQGNGG